MFWQWIFFSLSAPFLWALVNVGDRYLCSKTIRNEYAMTWVSVVLRLPLSIFFIGLVGWYIPAPREFILVILGGFLIISPFIFYFRALQKEDASRVTLLYYALSPLVTFILSMPLLGERFSAFDVIGSGVLLVAAGLTIIKFQKGFWHFHTGVLWIVIAGVLWPIQDIITKYLTPFFPSSLHLFAWMHVGSFLGGFLLLLFPEFRKNLRRENFRWPLGSWGIFLMNTVLFNIGFFALILALQLERVSLTIVLTASQPLWVFFIELVGRKFTRQLEPPDLSRFSLIAKSTACMLVLLGIWLFTL